MIFSYEKFSTILKELILLPSDYPYLYTNDNSTKIYLGEKITGDWCQKALLHS